MTDTIVTLPLLMHVAEELMRSYASTESLDSIGTILYTTRERATTFDIGTWPVLCPSMGRDGARAIAAVREAVLGVVLFETTLVELSSEHPAFEAVMAGRSSPLDVPPELKRDSFTIAGQGPSGEQEFRFYYAEPGTDGTRHFIPMEQSWEGVETNIMPFLELPKAEALPSVLHMLTHGVNPHVIEDCDPDRVPLLMAELADPGFGHATGR
jgi:hypothetical protein